MNHFFKIVFLLLFIVTATFAQSPNDGEKNPLPYHEIPAYPDKMTAGTALGRIIDGLGYRYYWATKDLTEKDLNFEPGNEGRKAREVLDHLYGLSLTIKQTARGEANIRPLDIPDWTWEERRVQTLRNIKDGSDALKGLSDEAINQLEIIFQRGERQSRVPIWHLMNGPIDDAIYHVGQIVSFRRSAGNPMNPFVNVFMGKTKE